QKDEPASKPDVAPETRENALARPQNDFAKELMSLSQSKSPEELKKQTGSKFARVLNLSPH
ncbi:hypothetical protein, partial [Campylobacter concisus]|uniref:hypothetical protein n=1 Tax=Campylobacter concisus TaxID=199 RepID=UPI00122C3535